MLSKEKYDAAIRAHHESTVAGEGHPIARAAEAAGLQGTFSGEQLAKAKKVYNKFLVEGGEHPLKAALASLQS